VIIFLKVDKRVSVWTLKRNKRL